MAVAPLTGAAGTAAVDAPPWHVTGSYFEACNCLAICPCRRRGGRQDHRPDLRRLRLRAFVAGAAGIVRPPPARRSRGDHGRLVPAGRTGPPWRVCLYVDERATPDQHVAVAEHLHRPGRGHCASQLRRRSSARSTPCGARTSSSIIAATTGACAPTTTSSVSGATPVESPLAISCGVPGHDRPGEELRTEVMQVNDSPLIWGVQARCGFATTFAYQSED